MDAAGTSVQPRPRILIVDDSRSVRLTLARHVAPAYEVCEASDGIEAWGTLLIDTSVCIVITDLAMPHLDGYGLLERIRSSTIGRIRALPVLVVSGAQEPGDHDRIKAAGATRHISKGTMAEDLLRHLAALLEQAPSQCHVLGKIV